MAVRRVVEDSIKEGVAGVRSDDQPIEGKRGTGTAGMEVAPLEVVLTRYRAAVERKRELDPNFVVIAQCYAGEAANGGMEEALHRLKAYKELGEVDWVQFTAPRSPDDVKWFAALSESAGGPEQGAAVWQSFMDTVAESQTEVGHHHVPEAD